jgi:hypothetical protein
MRRFHGKAAQKSIGGALRYDLLAQLHRPTDPTALQIEVRRLAGEQRLSPSDISVALRLSLPQVREMLSATSAEAAEIHAEAWKS